LKIYILLVLLFFSINPTSAQPIRLNNSKIPLTTVNLNLRVLIEGLYDGSVMKPDTVTVELHDPSSISSIIDSQKGVLNTNGNGLFIFTKAVNGSPYFIVVKHRNAIETWSANAQTFSSSTLSYDFTTADVQAYGNNLILKGGKYCIYSGDITQDGQVSFSDLIAIDNDGNNYVTGYTNTDLTGDNQVTFSDLIIVDNNNSHYISKSTPPETISDSFAYKGQTYHTVLIGTQYWLKENLNVGTMIISGDSLETNNGIIEKFCVDNNTDNCDIYGGLYQWDEAMQYVTTEGAKGICPDGWHIPTINEFSILKATVNDTDGNALKAIGQGTGDGQGTNTSGFSALLSGYHHPDFGFFDLNFSTDFWSSNLFGTTDTKYMYLLSSDHYINLDHNDKRYGYSVRCIRN
jgi:uncharacterized protein (TIGR02145 family)